MDGAGASSHTHTHTHFDYGLLGWGHWTLLLVAKGGSFVCPALLALFPSVSHVIFAGRLELRYARRAMLQL